MPLYFFHLRQGEKWLEDPDGRILPNLAVAQLEALADARDILANYVKAGVLIDGQKIDIVDDRGKMLMTVPLRDALNLPE